VGLISFKGIYPYMKKMSVGVDLSQMPASEFYNVPLKLKNIAESEPVVHVGDVVKQGSLIAKPSGKFGVNIFSPCSGKVLNILQKMNSHGELCKHVLIMNAPQDETEVSDTEKPHPFDPAKVTKPENADEPKRGNFSGGMLS